MHSSGQDLNKGDVLLSNHPAAGGSHLPDLTVITPVCWVFVRNYEGREIVVLQVFYPGNDSPVFFVANRGHHADIGGKTPGKDCE